MAASNRIEIQCNTAAWGNASRPKSPRRWGVFSPPEAGTTAASGDSASVDSTSSFCVVVTKKVVTVCDKQA